MEILIQDIQKNMKEDDRLPSEREICEMYNVSRATVRQAMQEMERDGYICRSHGKGTFVASQRVNQELLKFYSFTEEMKKLGKIPSSRVLSFEVMGCSKKIADKLSVKDGSMVYKMLRLRLADNKPMMIERTYLPYERFPGLTRELFEKTAMYDIFTQKYGVKFTSAKEKFQSVNTSEEEAKYLQVAKEIPSLKIERYTFESEKVIEYTISIARGDKFEYCITLQK
ncbi:GntR family transcriptional regulator [Lucifera butyrica]|nr:GntR family transcriptional regulator [Lucifera butyrica]